MFSRRGSPERPSAASRFSVPTTIAFAGGAGLALLVAYTVVAGAVRQRSDQWLVGEARTLAEVAGSATPGRLQETVVGAIAELARGEIAPAEPGGRDGHVAASTVFFLMIAPDGRPAAWVGPGVRDEVIAALADASPRKGVPFSLAVRGEEEPFRVGFGSVPDGTAVYLGLIDRQAEHMLHDIAVTFAWLWTGMLLFGMVVARNAAKRILGRVDAITESVARLGTGDLSRRVPEEPRHRDEISRLVSTFNLMLSRIEDGLRAIRTLADGLAHDLKSPLTAIRGNLDLAAGATESTTAADAIGRSIDGVDRTLRTLDAFLDAAEADAGVLSARREPLDLGDLAEQMVDLYRPAAEELGLALDVQRAGDTRLAADPQLLGRALGNLLDNALTHLPRGCRTNVRVTAAEATVRLEVEDDGPGFPVEVRERAFERFRGRSEAGGRGLGLAVVRAAAQAHGGKAVLAAGPRGGALVVLDLPRA